MKTNFTEYTMRDFGRTDVADAPENRERRNAMMSQLPGRVDAGVQVVRAPRRIGFLGWLRPGWLCVLYALVRIE